MLLRLIAASLPLAQGRLRSRENGNACGTGARRRGFHSERRKTLVHEWPESGGDRRDGENAPENGKWQIEKPDHRFLARDGHARSRDHASLVFGIHMGVWYSYLVFGIHIGLYI